MASSQSFDNFLAQQVKNVSVTKELRAQINHLSEQIRLCLVNSRRWSVDRHIIAGSVGKNTALSEDYDVDVVVFFNNPLTDRERLKEEIAEELLREFRPRLLMKPITKGMCVTINLDGIKFDIVPAENMVHSSVASAAMASEQRRGVLEILQMEVDPRIRARYSSSMAEFAVQSVRDTNHFVHQVILLCKHWKKSSKWSTYVSGLTSLVETLAKVAAQEALSQGKGLGDAIDRFSKMVGNLPSTGKVTDCADPWLNRLDFFKSRRDLVDFSKLPSAMDFYRSRMAGKV